MTDSVIYIPKDSWIYNINNINFQHWGIPLSRRFRSLKLWFVIRSYGITGLQAYIREHCRLAKVFEKYCLQDDRFVVCNDVKVGNKILSFVNYYIIFHDITQRIPIIIDLDYLVGVGMFSTERKWRTQPKASEYNKCLRKTSHGASFRKRTICY